MYFGWFNDSMSSLLILNEFVIVRVLSSLLDEYLLVMWVNGQ